MANEQKLAAAARAIARELDELPSVHPYPFGPGQVFKGYNGTPCCVVGHVIHRAALSALVQGTGLMSSNVAIASVRGEMESSHLQEAIDDVVEANDCWRPRQASNVAKLLYKLAVVLEMAAFELSEEEEE